MNLQLPPLPPLQGLRREEKRSNISEMTLLMPSHTAARKFPPGFPHLYRGACHCPNTSVPNHPGTDTKRHCHTFFTAMRRQASSVWEMPHPDKKRRVKNVLYCPGKRVGVDDKLVIRYWRCCCDKQEHTRNLKCTRWCGRNNISQVDFKLTINLGIKLQVSQDSFNLFLCCFLVGFFHFLQLIQTAQQNDQNYQNIKL